MTIGLPEILILTGKEMSGRPLTFETI